MISVWFQWLFIWTRSWLKNFIDFAIGQGSKQVQMKMWCLLLMFLYTWFMGKLVYSDRSVLTELWGTELVFFGWDSAQVTQFFCLILKNSIPLCFLRFPHLQWPHCSLPSSRGETVWLSHAWADAMWRDHSLLCGHKTHRLSKDPTFIWTSLLWTNQMLQINTRKQTGKLKVLAIYFC